MCFEHKGKGSIIPGHNEVHPFSTISFNSLYIMHSFITHTSFWLGSLSPMASVFIILPVRRYFRQKFLPEAKEVVWLKYLHVLRESTSPLQELIISNSLKSLTLSGKKSFGD